MDALLLNEAGQCVERRDALLKLIKKAYPDKDGALLFCSAFEKEREQFYQDSSFQYFFGLQEPAILMYQPLAGQAVLLTPNYAIDRGIWLPETFDAERLAALGVEKTETLGKSIHGYSTGPFFTKESLEDLCKLLQEQCKAGNSIFVPLTNVATECRLVMNQLCEYIPELKKHLVDIDPLIAQLRKTKSQHELEYLYHAAEITAMAHQAAAGVIRKGSSEADVQAAIEYIYTESGATRAFASVVGSGVNSTILHYVDNKAQLADKGLVVVDIGASFNHYCSDVTRTYPVAGKFSERQKQVYQDVLDCQAHVAKLAKPGMFLRNKEQPEKCLNTLAHNFLQERGYDVDKAFPHGIGHFVGLDVHDVGDYTVPLAVGDVITIEPGIYLRSEELGVRIEDVYWIVKDGVVCLTEQVPKNPEELENFMQASRFSDDSEPLRTGPNEH
jgi:Xaa-Pro aminopeptidase